MRLQKLPTISVAVPAYSRAIELCDLIDSVLNGNALPDELLIVEDNSPERNEIRSVVERYKKKFDSVGCILSYLENDVNLGYDGNLRKSIEESTSDYVIVLGNDDALLPNAIKEVKSYIVDNPNVNFISRTYSRFSEKTTNIINTTWLSKSDTIFDLNNSSSGFVFRLCGFVGGLIVNRNWAKSVSTESYDGTLYYQYYLACLAFLDRGVGYISEPIALGRADNPPLFGSAASENEVHIPGSYTPKGRAKMWSGILRITSDVDRIYHVNLFDGIKKELSHRQSFHIFEMMPLQGRKATLSLFNELRKIGLTSDWLPCLLVIYILIFGKYASLGFSAFRQFQFVFEKNIKLKL